MSMKEKQNCPAIKLPLFILAGGLGTRLNSVLDGLPKALAPINGRPFLYLQIEHWISQGCSSFVFLLHHQAEMILQFLEIERYGLLKDCQVRYIVEPRPLGTGGAVAYAINQEGFSGDFLVANADTWLGSGISKIMQASSPSIMVVHRKDIGRYGEVVFDGDFKVTSFSEKKMNQISGWINAGLYCVNDSYFKLHGMEPFSLEEVILPWLVSSKKLKAIPLDTEFIDIGIPDDYGRFCRWVETNGKVSL